jgi:hypothetical protein
MRARFSEVWRLADAAVAHKRGRGADFHRSGEAQGKLALISH